MCMTDLYGKYTHAVATTLEFLLSEKAKRKKALQRAKPYKKHLYKSITYNDIDSIMSAAFGPSPRYMGDIRRCHLNPEKNKSIRPREDSSWNFNAKLLKDECMQYQIDISQKMDQILQLFFSTSTLEKVLDTDDDFVTANFKNLINQNIEKLEPVFEKSYGTQYWKITFRYLPKCAILPDIRSLMELLPQCKKKSIDNWKRQLENISSPLSRGKRCALENIFSILQDYSKELRAINKSTPCTWEEVKYTLTVEELFYATNNISLIQTISEHKLSADILDIAFGAITQLSSDQKDILRWDIIDELDLDYALAF